MTDAGAAKTLMWEAKAAPGRADDLLELVLAHADPAADVFRSADGRVVIIDPTGRGMPELPSELMARPPHAWRFESVPRETRDS